MTLSEELLAISAMKSRLPDCGIFKGTPARTDIWAECRPEFGWDCRSLPTSSRSCQTSSVQV